MFKFFQAFSFIIVVLYFIAGFYILLSEKLEYIPKNIRIVFALFLISYGGFRLVRLYQKIKNKDEDF
jgi:hypothetical protein